MNNKPIEISFRSEHSLLAMTIGFYVAIFYASSNLEDISLAILASNVTLMIVLSFIGVNLFALFAKKLGNLYGRNFLMGVIFILFSYYMKMSFFHNHSFIKYVVAPLEEISAYFPVAIFFIFAGSLSLLFRNKVREITIVILICSVLPFFSNI